MRAIPSESYKIIDAIASFFPTPFVSTKNLMPVFMYYILFNGPSLLSLKY